MPAKIARVSLGAAVAPAVVGPRVFRVSYGVVVAMPVPGAHVTRVSLGIVVDELPATRRRGFMNFSV